VRAWRPVHYRSGGRPDAAQGLTAGLRRIEIAGHQRLRLASPASRENTRFVRRACDRNSTGTARRRCRAADSGRPARSQRTCPHVCGQPSWRAACAGSAWRASERLFRRQQAPMPGTKPASITGSGHRRQRPILMLNMRMFPVLSSREQLRRPGRKQLRLLSVAGHPGVRRGSSTAPFHESFHGLRRDIKYELE
jgi:hypothetical protein